MPYSKVSYCLPGKPIAAKNFVQLAHRHYITIHDLCISFIGPNTYNENETIAKYEIMDGAPVRGIHNIFATFVMNILKLPYLCERSGAQWYKNT